MTVTIACSEEQARTIVAALDLLMRVHLGQWRVLTERVPWDLGCQDRLTRWQNRDVAADVLTSLATLYTGLTGHASHSLSSPVIDDEARVAGDIRGAIRHALWAAQPEGERDRCTVDSAPPMRYAEEPLPTVTVRGR